MRLDYETELEKIYDQIGPSKTMPLATSSQDRPTVRLMSCIIHERKIYFQTGVDLLKYQQIQENNRVALCADNIQIEGTAKVIGKTKYSRDSEIIEAYKKYHLKSYNTYANSDVEVLIEVTPTLITKWDYEDGEPFRVFLDPKKQIANKEMYF